MEHTLDANFADTITLLGYDLPQNKVLPGESFPLTLHIRANRTMGENLTIFNHLLDVNAVQHGGSDRIPKQYYTTLLWVPAEIVSDSYQVNVEPTAPPGVYWLDAGFYPTDQPELSLSLMVDGQPIARNSVLIGPIKVGGPPADVTVTTVSPQHTLNAAFGNEVTLAGYDWNMNTEGLVTGVTLYWQTDRPPVNDYTIFVHLLDEAGSLVAQADGPPANGAYPTSLWEPGEIIVDKHELPITHNGSRLLVGLYEPVTGQRLPVADSPDNAVSLSPATTQ
jgi:hypothetical protein